MERLKSITIIFLVLLSTLTQAKAGAEEKSNLEVLETTFEPIHQGKNVVRVKVQNTSEQEQTFVIHIQTRSPDYGLRGMGWGTPFFDRVAAKETKWTRCAFEIQGPITEATWIRLKFYNPASAGEYDPENWFKKIKLTSSDVEVRKPDESLLVSATKKQAQLVTEIFGQFQSYIREKKHEEAWGLLTEDHNNAGQMNTLEKFIRRLEEPAYARFYWDKKQFVKLKAKAVTARDEVLTLRATLKDQVWTIDFVREDDQWKIDWIAGYTPAVLIQQDWQRLLLPQMEKHSTKHFDIYYYKNSTAEKEIDQIAGRKEKGFQKICRFLGKDSDVRILMVFFEDGKTKQMMTGHQGAGWAFGNTIVEIYNEQQKLDPYHETAHVLMRPYGNPPALFNEGFAVYMSERLGAHGLESLGGGQSSIYQRVKELKSKGEWIPLKELITYTDIGPKWSRPPVAYPEAASFVKFLMDSYGKDKFLQTYKTLKNSNDKSVQQQNMETLQQIYGQSLQQLEEQWKTAIFSSS